jgi:muramoyltetrapeptide carboxypeptidase
MKQKKIFKFIAPSSAATATNLQNCLDFADAYHAEAVFGKNSSKQFYDLAGTDKERLEDFNKTFSSECEAIFAIRGGYGSARLLDLINFESLKKLEAIPPFFGYSDTTALQLALWKKCQIKTYSGLLPGVDFDKELHCLTSTYFSAILERKIIPPISNLAVFKSGEASGTLLGGCLSVLNSILGTPYCPDFQNSVLFLEEINEPTYVIDRLLNQLKSCGVLQNLAGLVFGSFTKCPPRNEQEFPLDLVLKHYAKFVNGPVCYNLPYGHIKEKVILPIGGKVYLNAYNNTLTFLDK